ncbi:hypothetical protein J6590_003291 [Homalodisca vitripennis]|nr:hypothetical protein J6590_003291 [Homalodisca vitripennis]
MSDVGCSLSLKAAPTAYKVVGIIARELSGLGSLGRLLQTREYLQRKFVSSGAVIHNPQTTLSEEKSENNLLSRFEASGSASKKEDGASAGCSNYYQFKNIINTAKAIFVESELMTVECGVGEPPVPPRLGWLQLGRLRGEFTVCGNADKLTLGKANKGEHKARDGEKRLEEKARAQKSTEISSSRDDATKINRIRKESIRSGGEVRAPIWKSYVGSLMLQNSMFGSLMFDSSILGNLKFGSPVFGTPMCGSPMFGSAMFGSPMCGSPMFGSAMFGSPMCGIPMFGSAMF